MPETLHNAPIAIVDEDNFGAVPAGCLGLDPPQFTQPAMIDYRDVDPGMDAGLYTFALVIPPQLPARRAGGAIACRAAQCRRHPQDPGLHWHWLHPEDRHR